jgi:hypothetical protein
MTACCVVLKRDAGVSHCVVMDTPVGVVREAGDDPIGPT